MLTPEPPLAIRPCNVLHTGSPVPRHAHGAACVSCDTLSTALSISQPPRSRRSEPGQGHGPDSLPGVEQPSGRLKAHDSPVP